MNALVPQHSLDLPPVSALAAEPIARLVAWGKAAIERAASFHELKEFRSRVEALRVYQRDQGASTEAVSAATQLRIRTDRRMGEELTRTEKARGGRPPETGNTALPVLSEPTLAEYGIGKMQSSRWQQLAAIPADLFDAILETHERHGIPVSTAGVLRAAERAIERGQSADDLRAAPPPAPKDRARNQERWWSTLDRTSDRELRRTLSGDSARSASPLVAGPASGERWRLLQCSVADLVTEPAESIDAIVTDPPYPEEFLPLYGELGRVAMHLLKPGGLLLCMTGQMWFGAVFDQLRGAGLQYEWLVAYLTPGGQAVQVFPRKVNSFWKPVLVFSKGGGRLGGWFGDVARSDPNDNDKRHHHWGQSESGMLDLMRRFVLPGQTVCDPFLGGGTTALVALEIGTSFLGCDIDAGAIEATKARLVDVSE